ncbi:PH domain-containing protein [Modestobacter sp. I12A-02628]|uniref:PH domain-containing protein n=2 Tax=Goekera deserti TaxID=2497753 RepID=A0A7K3WKH7_9ACTN|nr:PH domain-containing protein [Goekera deserti]NDI48432.1 PH domain-containing protein [Goekera deserti]NEL56033.1 PH domain-containing protein [Goekera deserti]
MLVHTVTFRQARSFVPAMLGLAAAIGSNIDPSPLGIAGLVLLVTVLSLGFAALGWWRFSYADTDSAVVVTRGLLARSVRTVPIDRVRGVEVEAPPLYRLFGLVRLRIDAAAGAVQGSEEELVVDGLRPAEADRLRARLLTRRAAPAPVPGQEPVPGAPGPAPAAGEPEEEFARFDNRWLLYSPLVGSYLAIPFAALGALSRLTDELPDRFTPDLGQPDLSRLPVLLLAVVAALLVVLLGSVIGSAVVNWGFRLVRRGGSLVAARGLLTRRQTELEIDRIRGGTLSEGVGMRLVRAARSSALVTGLGDATRRGQLLPMGPRREAWALLTRLVEDPGALRRHPPAARRRRLVRAIGSGVVVLAAGLVLTATQGWWWVAVLGGVLTVLGVPLGLGRYASLGHVTGERSFSVRSGWLVREQVVLQQRAVVGWQVRQSFSQRRASLATVTACVGAGSGGYACTDMAADEAAAFALASSGRWAGTLTPHP